LEEAGEDSRQRLLYKLIRTRAIASQLADAQYAVRTAKLVAAQPVIGQAVEFLARGRTLTYAGWLKLLSGDQTEEKDGVSEASNPILKLKINDPITAIDGKLLEKKTKPPVRYTKATLVRKLESEGIGRPATYAAIMQNIESRAYVKLDKKFLMPTKEGALIVDSLVGKFDFMDLSFTRKVETQLDEIAQGTADYKSVINQVYEKLNKSLSSMQMDNGATPQRTLTSPCPKCGAAVISGQRTFECSASCGFSLWREVAGRKITDIEAGKLFKDREISALDGFVSKAKKKFSAGLILNAEHKVEFVFEDKPEDGGSGTEVKDLSLLCPQCHKPLKLRKSARGAFWGCTGYPDCNHTQPDENGKPVQKAPEQVKQAPTHVQGKTVKPKARAGQKCPDCETGELMGRVFKETNKAYVGCNQYPTCRFFAWPVV
jgi:DNA topoisomerase-1